MSDLLGLRVIVEPSDLEASAEEAECVERCRDVEALVHAMWPGAVETTKDYVVHPKANGYQSVHVMVRLPQGERVEVQIRTRCMHEHAEHGAASHAHYKADDLEERSRSRMARDRLLLI